jgi:putative ABC transport system permease protein
MKKEIQPPRLARALFSWYCKNASVEDLEGDAEEIFFKACESMPRWKAQLAYWKMVISLILSYSVKKRKKQASYHYYSTNSLDMFLNYFKVSWRSLARNRFFTIINALGLAVGMSISLLFISMLSYVTRYDEFHEKKERIYRVTTATRDEQRLNEFASSPPPLAEKLKAEQPGIDEVVRISQTLSGTAASGKKEIPLSGYFADETFLRVFTFPLLKGDAQTALEKPMSIVLTQSVAKKIFGDSEPLGSELSIAPWGVFEVTGVMKDHPKASHLYFEAVASYNSMVTGPQQPDDWNNFRDHYTYCLLSASTNGSDVRDYLSHLAKTSDTKTGHTSQSYDIQPLDSIALGKEYSNEIGPQWGYTTFLIFGILNLMILIPACFNYANISISRSLKRAKEIGLRKTVGGQGNQIFTQFITETIIVTLIALGGAFLIFTQIKEEFLAMIVSSQALDLTTDPRTIFYFVLFALFTGLIAGIIPAFYFSRLNPVQALKKTATVKHIKGLSFQKLLVVSQFALSLGFIMGVVIVLKQYRASLNYDFGFTQTNILDVELQDADPQRFRNEFSKLSSVNEISMSSDVIGTSLPQTSKVTRASTVNDSVKVYELYVDPKYLHNLQIEIIAGESFPSGDEAGRQKYIVVNEEFLKDFKISTADVLDELFIIDDSVQVQVAGVVKNFHYTNLREPIKAFMFRNDPTKFRYANLAVNSTDMFASIEEMEESWKSIGTTTTFQSRFFKDEIEETYSFYFSLIKLCGFLGFLAITISCLGLLGMVVYSTGNRMKELGIRKVMGASSYNLAVLLSAGYMKLMLVAAVIATPVTYLLFDQFLLHMQHYRFDIGLPEILISLLIMAVLGLATILSQTISAARSNPVDTLRSE